MRLRPAVGLCGLAALAACGPRHDDPVARVIAICDRQAPPLSDADRRRGLTEEEALAKDSAHRACMDRHLGRIR